MESHGQSVSREAIPTVQRLLGTALKKASCCACGQVDFAVGMKVAQHARQVIELDNHHKSSLIAVESWRFNFM